MSLKELNDSRKIKVKTNVLMKTEDENCLKSTEFEREELIIGNVAIYFKIEVHHPVLGPVDFNIYDLFVLLANLGKTNPKTIYSCNLSSEKLKIVNERFICDNSQWRLIHRWDNVTLKSFNFDLTVEMDIIDTQNPLSVLYDDTELVDFELWAMDGSVFFHSAALAAASPVLRQMLTGKWRETENRKLKLQDTTQLTLQHLKEYLYRSVLPDKITDIELLQSLASYYLMTDLETKCKDRLLLRNYLT